MYLHLGGNTAVDTDDIVAILDMDNITIAKNSREFLRRAEKNGELVSVDGELPKSVVVCTSGGKSTVYITSVSSKAVSARIKRLRDFSGYSLIPGGLGHKD